MDDCVLPATGSSPGPQQYTLTVTNSGTAPTTGQLTISIDVTLTSGVGNFTFSNLATAGLPDFTFIGSSPISGGVNLAYQSTPVYVLAPAASLTIPLDMSWNSGPNGGTILFQTTLPAGIGGETNSSNNTSSLSVTVVSVSN